MALDIAGACYSPDVVAHIPGIANTSADALSRLHQPNHPTHLPSYLSDVLSIHARPEGGIGGRRTQARLSVVLINGVRALCHLHIYLYVLR